MPNPAQLPVPPVAPTPPAASNRAAIAQGSSSGSPGIAVPQTAEELHSLIMLRDELRGQLHNIRSQRQEVFMQIVNTSTKAPGYAQLQERMAGYDQRIARLEQQVLATDDAISQGMAAGIEMPAQEAPTAYAVQPSTPNVGSMVEDIVAGQTAVFVVIAVIFWLLMRRRFRRAAAAPAADSARMDQLQQSVDAIALEVERISEGQRYVTKILNEKFPALGPGEAQPINMKRGEPVPARRSESEP